MHFPWRPTLREFLEHIQRERGVFVESDPVARPKGPVRYRYLDLEDIGRTIALARGLDLDDRLTPTVLRSLCEQFRIPPDDFRLDPDPDA